MSDDDYQVGYRKPPRHTQFLPGRSGNAKGRPKGSQNTITLIDQELEKKVTVRENGKARRLSKRAVLAANAVNNAVSKPGKDREYLLRLEAERAEKKGSEAPQTTADPIEAEITEAYVRNLVESRIEQLIAEGTLVRPAKQEEDLE